jgi:hypothetical protein
MNDHLHAPAALTLAKDPPGIHWIGGWTGLRSGMNDMEKCKFLFLLGLELRPSSVLQLVASRYTTTLPRLVFKWVVTKNIITFITFTIPIDNIYEKIISYCLISRWFLLRYLFSLNL